jgi:hypothetical protein
LLAVLLDLWVGHSLYSRHGHSTSSDAFPPLYVFDIGQI